jgi:hypothetical protein
MFIMFSDVSIYEPFTCSKCIKLIYKITVYVQIYFVERWESQRERGH